MINSGLHQYAMKYRQAIEEKGRPDIVIATQSTSLSYICNVALNGKNYNVIPQISWLHGPVSAYGGRELLSFSNSHMALCNKLGDDLALALDRENIYVVGNPVQIKNLDVIDRPKEILTILSLGRLSPEKDIETLINALAILKKPWRLIVVGDGGHYSTLRTLAEEKNKNSHGYDKETEKTPRRRDNQKDGTGDPDGQVFPDLSDVCTGRHRKRR